MKLYQTEKDFKLDFMARAREAGAFVTPIQTRTVPGVPDLFLTHSTCGEHWIECKFINRSFGTRDDLYSIPFRPGQQAWAWQYFMASPPCNTALLLVAFASGEVFYYRMTKPLAGGLMRGTDLRPFDMGRKDFLKQLCQ